jgi:hypothetical protein
MPSTSHRRVAAVMIASMLTLGLVPAAAFAKSSHSRSRAAAAAATTAVQQGTSAGSYYYPSASDRNIYSRLNSRGNVIDNTAGWGDVGAR